jgi:hypothetical protein
VKIIIFYIYSPIFTVNTMVKGRCMKCKVAREIKNPVEMMMSNGGARIAGSCPVCGTKMGAIIAVNKASPALQAKIAAYKKKKHGGEHKSRKSRGSRRSHKSRS